MRSKIKMTGLLLLFCLYMKEVGFSQAVPDPVAKKIDKLFAFWNNPASPGCAVGIVRGDSLVFAKGYGMANLEYNIPITPATIFHMASISKQFTAYSIVLLAARGKLSLDDDVRKYLSWFPDLHEKITIRHLLNHTSGIRDQWQLLAIAGTRLDDVITQEQVVKILGQQQALNFKPGEKYSYSNSGFTMLAEIVHIVTGQTLRAFTDSAIFKPLGIDQTHFHDDYTEIEPNRAYSYQRKGLMKFSNSVLSYSTAGATSLFTNINDLSKWVVNFYKPVAGTEENIKQLTQKGKLNNGSELNYALGISSDNYKGWRQYSHSGSDAGFRTYIMVLPDLKFGVMVFSNLADAIVSMKADQVADLFIKDSGTKKTAPEVGIDSSRAMLRNETVAKKMAGRYISEDGSQFSFVLRGHRLYWERGTQHDMLYPGPLDSFTIVNSPEEGFVLEAGDENNTSIVQYWPDNKRLLVKYSTDSITETEMRKYEGDYYCPELGCTYSIVLKNKSLVLTSRKYEDSKITPVGADHLFCDYWWMKHMMIIRNVKKAITGFEVNDGRIMHLQFNKLK